MSENLFNLTRNSEWDGLHRTIFTISLVVLSMGLGWSIGFFWTAWRKGREDGLRVQTHALAIAVRFVKVCMLEPLAIVSFFSFLVIVFMVDGLFETVESVRLWVGGSMFLAMVGMVSLYEAGAWYEDRTALSSIGREQRVAFEAELKKRRKDGMR